MTHGIVVINTILLPAPQDGLAMNKPRNVLWLIQEMDLEVNQHAKTSAVAVEVVVVINIDATPKTIPARYALKKILDAVLIELPHAMVVKMAQIKHNSLNVIKLIQINQNVILVVRTNPNQDVHQ